MSDDKNMQTARARLLGLQAGLAETRAQSADSRRPVTLDQTSVGRVSRIDAMQVQAMAIEAERRRGVEAARIAAALARIDDETYGECLRCGEDIAPARLDFDPAATVCIDCARGAG